jgi:DnaJ-class molecular chaperone
MPSHNPLTDPQAGVLLFERCEECGGRGKTPPDPWGNKGGERTCHACNGKGWCRKNKAEVVGES